MHDFRNEEIKAAVESAMQLAADTRAVYVCRDQDLTQRMVTAARLRKHRLLVVASADAIMHARSGVLVDTEVIIDHELQLERPGFAAALAVLVKEASAKLAKKRSEQ